MGLEVSRLAPNCADWHRLLEICALSGTLSLDEGGLRDPCHFNDRLLLGLKGTMSEAELHVLKARLRGGILSKAQRGHPLDARIWILTRRSRIAVFCVWMRFEIPAVAGMFEFRFNESIKRSSEEKNKQGEQ
jgi:DNA invertase Pin-like site-specific DNA recombinase